MKTTQDKILYKFLYELTSVFESSRNPADLATEIKKALQMICEIKSFKIYIYDEITKTLKDFSKIWENLAIDAEASVLADYYDLFSYKTTEYITKNNIIYFPLVEKDKTVGIGCIEGNFSTHLFEILPLFIKQISYAVSNLKYSESMKISTKFYQTVRNIAKILETQYELNYILPILGEIIDGFISEHLIYIFLKNPKKKEYKLVWPSKCSNENIFEYLLEITPKTDTVIKDDDKTGIFPLVCENKILGAIVAYNRMGKLAKSETEYLEQLSKQASATINRASSYMKTLEHATLDALTGLNNRHQFALRLRQEIATAKRQKTPLCCIMTDIDFFKSVNDTYGHAVGDVVLKNTAKVIKKELREYDTASRYGGEEFAILLPYTTLDEAIQVAERLRVQIQKKKINIEEFKIDGKTEVSVTISIGIASYDASMKEPDELYQKADKGLYAAKENGRNKVVVAGDSFLD